MEDQVYAQHCAERRRERILAQLSPSLRDDLLVNALASLEAGCDYTSALNAFVEEQWSLFKAAQELEEGRAEAEAEAKTKAKLDSPPEEEIKSVTSANDFQ
jgi:hypothetical protein